MRIIIGNYVLVGANCFKYDEFCDFANLASIKSILYEFGGKVCKNILIFAKICTNERFLAIMEDKKTLHLIANTGIQFHTNEIEFNPSEPLGLKSGRMLRYSFVESVGPFDGHISFDLLFNNVEKNCWIPVKQLRNEGYISMLQNGSEEVDETGVPKMRDDVSTELLEQYSDEDESIININTFESFRVTNPENLSDKVPGLELLLGKWLPMPMFETDAGGNSMGVPMGWCRVMIQRTGEGSEKGVSKYRLTWAFDTHLADNPLSTYFPYFYDENDKKKSFALCNKPDLLFNFLSIVEEQNAVSQYIATLLHINPDKLSHHRYKFIAYYIYLINFLRLSEAAPKVTLYNPTDGDVEVDMVLDIGNSRTCGVLFEDGDFTRSVMLELRDLSSPWLTYKNPFDMRLVYRRADFGNDLILPEEAFNWKSIVRVGEEARSLVYHSIEDSGIAERANNYSSPKRYLWDKKKSQARWEFLVTETDPFNVQQSPNIFLKNFTDMFDERGTFKEDADTVNIFDMAPEETGSDCHYSRSSMMTFVMVEVLQQAIAQINSPAFRAKHGRIDCRRRMRNVIITCPTAMPLAEQIALRQSMVDAQKAMLRCNPSLTPINVIPSPKSLKITDDYDSIDKRQWSYDEASACQLVYLYAEIAQRYNGKIDKFFEAKGHKRQEFAEEGYDKNSLTIGSIDIGAGTTDIMICSYKYEGEQQSCVTPVPHFYDSFYVAGDDILRNIVQRFVIEGPETGVPFMGSIHSALVARLLAMSNEELRALPCTRATYTDVYRTYVEDITGCQSQERREDRIRYFASVLVRDFFGYDSAMMSFKDRQARVDFNTQISVPIAREMMDLLRRKFPSKVYSYDELFADLKPSEHLLNHFANHFGFRFEELSWRYDPEEIASMIRATMEPLMKQLSILLYAYQCDILVLAGRPTTIDAIPELFIKYYPMSPDRIICLNDYRVGTWYPFADGQGYFYDQKSVVAVGAMVGYMASTTGFNGLRIDFKEMIRKMKSTANFVGVYDEKTQQVNKSLLMPNKSNATTTVGAFPIFLGCKQFDSPLYQARPLYGLYFNGKKHEPLRITLTRSYQENKEVVEIEEITDMQGNVLPKSNIEIVQQSIVADGKHWLDKGEFELALK